MLNALLGFSKMLDTGLLDVIVSKLGQLKAVCATGERTVLE